MHGGGLNSGGLAGHGSSRDHRTVENGGLGVLYALYGLDGVAMEHLYPGVARKHSVKLLALFHSEGDNKQCIPNRSALAVRTCCLHLCLSAVVSHRLWRRSRARGLTILRVLA